MTGILPAPRRGGFALMEVMLALLVFAWVGTALASAMYSIGKVANDVRKELVLTRILDSELRRVMTLPQLEEGVEEFFIEEGEIDLRTEVIPIEELENENGQLLQDMYAIQVTARWRDGLEVYEETVETWRYARLYQP